MSASLTVYAAAMRLARHQANVRVTAEQAHAQARRVMAAKPRHPQAEPANVGGAA